MKHIIGWLLAEMKALLKAGQKEMLDKLDSLASRMDARQATTEAKFEKVISRMKTSQETMEANQEILETTD
jgi:hypothetical protein